MSTKGIQIKLEDGRILRILPESAPDKDGVYVVVIKGKTIIISRKNREVRFDI